MITLCRTAGIFLSPDESSGSQVQSMIQQLEAGDGYDDTSESASFLTFRAFSPVHKSWLDQEYHR